MEFRHEGGNSSYPVDPRGFATPTTGNHADGESIEFALVRGGKSPGADLEGAENEQTDQHDDACRENRQRGFLDFQSVLARVGCDCHSMNSFHEATRFENSSTVGGTEVTYLKFGGANLGEASLPGQCVRSQWRGISGNGAARLARLAC